MSIEEIAAKLQIGDKKSIANTTGYSEHYVKAVFSNTRNENAKGAKTIVRAALDLIQFRQEQMKKYKTA